MICAEYAFRFWGFSAIDRYLGLPALGFVWAETPADLGALAKAFETLRFPGAGLADAAHDRAEQTWYFRCRGPDDPPHRPSYPLLSFMLDEKTNRFHDPAGVYPIVRSFKNRDAQESCGDWAQGLNPRAEAYRAALDAALILARYTQSDAAVGAVAEAFRDMPKGPPPNQETQRVFLTCLLESARPDLGLNLLKQSGFIADFWPELDRLDEVDQSKEFHPEGNVWTHTLETFRYRKQYDLRLSLALLLHDAGKPLATASGSRRFNGHAELGAAQARRFLKRLGFDPQIIQDVWFLVRNHMLPAALPRLPLTITGNALESPLFPRLLELYRCDESAAFKGLEGYYESGAAYQAYLRSRKNPFRSNAKFFS